MNNSGASNNSNTFSRRAYPLRRTKGEVTVDILLVNNQTNSSEAGGGSGDNNSCSSSSNNTSCSVGPSEGKVNGSSYNNRLVNGTGGSSNKSSNNKRLCHNGIGAIGSGSCGGRQTVQNDPMISPNNDDNHARTDEIEERALIEKWMQLEEVRNEQVQGDEQWAWDWDGVERTYTKVLRNGGMRQRQLIMQQHRQFEVDEDDIDVDLILEGAGLPSPEGKDQGGIISIEERNALNETQQKSSVMQIDSSTWTKSKSSKKPASGVGNKEAVAKKMDETVMVVSEAGGRKSSNNSQEASPEKVRRREEEGDQILLVLEGEREIENEDGLLIKRARDGVVHEDFEGPKKSHKMPINLDENGIVVTSSSSAGPGDCGEEADGEEDDPPPVIEFTPEFYRLANYGSNLSFSDNDSTQASSPNSPKVSSSTTTGGGNSNKSGSTSNSGNSAATTCSGSPAVRSPKRRKHLTRRSHLGGTASNINGSSASAAITSGTTATTVVEVDASTLTMDDKISQTDFSCSSLENMSSVSSDLSAECRNCLEIIKKLVGHAEAEEEESSNGGGDSAESEELNGAFLDEKGGRTRRTTIPEANMDAGSYATTWISVPKGLPTAEVSSFEKRESFF